MVPFPWFGGKGRYHLDFILPLLPNDCTTFVDVFGGSGAVLLNRKPVPVEVLNDVNHDLVTFFRVLRTDPEPLLKDISLTPYSREEHRIACQQDDDVSDRERARRFFVRTDQSISGKAHEYRPSSWSYRTGAGNTVRFRTRVWRGRSDRLARVADRLLDVQVECSAGGGPDSAPMTMRTPSSTAIRRTSTQPGGRPVTMGSTRCLTTTTRP